MRTKLQINPVTGELDLVSRVEFREVEIDFGVSPRSYQEAILNDPFVTPNSIIVGNISYKATSTGKDADEAGMEEWQLGFTPLNGKVKITIEAFEGRVYGVYKISYTVA